MNLISEKALTEKIWKSEKGIYKLCKNIETPYYSSKNFKQMMHDHILNALLYYGITNIIYCKKQGDSTQESGEIGPNLPYTFNDCPCGEGKQPKIVCKHCQLQYYCSREHLRLDCNVKHKILCPIIRELLSLKCNSCNSSVLLYHDYVYGNLDDIKPMDSLDLNDTRLYPFANRLRCMKCFLSNDYVEHYFKLKIAENITKRIYIYFDTKISELLYRYSGFESYLSPFLVCYVCKTIVNKSKRRYCQYCKKIIYCSKHCKELHKGVHEQRCIEDRYKTVACNFCRKLMNIDDLEMVKMDLFYNVNTKQRFIDCLCSYCFQMHIFFIKNE